MLVGCKREQGLSQIKGARHTTICNECKTLVKITSRICSNKEQVVHSRQLAPSQSILLIRIA